MELEGKIKLRVQRNILIFSVLIFFGKLLAYFLTNSVGILTDALESTVNVATGFITLISLKIALKPRDENHPYGHGKIELLSASIEGIFIIIAGIFILIEAVKRFIYPSDIEKLDYGILIIAISGLLNFLLGYYSIRTGKKYNSIALISGGKHLYSDTYSTIGLVIGLLILYFTNIYWLDSVIAILFGFIIIYTGLKILKETTSNLMDEADFEAISKLADVINKNRKDNWINLHNFKIVKYGNIQHIDCDLTLPWYYSLKEAHMETDNLKRLIMENYNECIDITIHMDDCSYDLCNQCRVAECKYRKYEFTNKLEWTLKNVIKREFDITKKE